VLPLNDTVCELKNIAVKENFQNSGLGSKMLGFLFSNYGGWYDKMVVGTAEDGAEFYEKNGFIYSHTVRDFFTDNYEEPVLNENGEEYADMYYFKRPL
jgi:ribosomal protein S18 acetylase RimI-like enzyme